MTSENPVRKKKNNIKNGLFIKPYFTNGNNPYREIKWEFRSSKISNDKGTIVFEQNNIEVPTFWSQMALNVVSSKYFHGEKNTPNRETSVKQLINRVVSTIKNWGIKDNYFTNQLSANNFELELKHILVNQLAAFNSPVWFNVGIVEKPQCSACFILSVEDDMESLLDLQRIEGKLFKFGSGTGTNLSSLRSSKEKLSGGGIPSGPISFMRGFDAWAGIIKSGGKTRRAAKMQILNVEHPDILDFIDAKAKEEKKAWALIDSGYSGNFSVSGGAYDSVAFQNANFSVRVNDEFMEAVKRRTTYYTKEVQTGKLCEEFSAEDVLRKISENTHLCGDPGIQFDSTINEWHTCPKSGRINASNPCSEYMHVDNSACNLASINLLRFLSIEGEFDLAGYLHTIEIMLIAQDILIDNASYPTEKVAQSAHNFRQLGFGYANLGAFLMSLGLPYDSDSGRAWASLLTALMTGQAYLTSAEMAQKLGAFNGFKLNSSDMLRVINKHQEALQTLSSEHIPKSFSNIAENIWAQAYQLGKQFGYRNSQTTVLAPTGTISFLMDCDTTGIEPDISLVKYKLLSDGGMLKLVNKTVERALVKLGYSNIQINEIISYIDQYDTIEGTPHLKESDLAVFDCAFQPANGKRFIHHLGHLRMMAVTQPFISGAISKTVNLPKDISSDEIFEIYMTAWEMDIKAVALYRDGSKRVQPLSTKKDDSANKKEIKNENTISIARKRLADERSSITHKFSVGGLEGYLTVGLYDTGQPGEIFLVVAKEGSTLSGMFDAFATAISIALQYGVPLEALVRKFAHSRFEPSGFTNNYEIPMAKSVIDYVFRWLALKFLNPEQLKNLGLKNIASELKQNDLVAVTATPSSKTSSITKAINTMQVFKNMEDAPPCTNCGSDMMVRQAGCYVCINCGTQGGCG